MPLRGLPWAVLALVALHTGSAAQEPPTSSGSRTCPGHAVAVRWTLPVGCDFNGFFVELLGYLPSLANATALCLVLDTGKCSDEMLGKLSRPQATALARLQAPPVLPAGADQLPVVVVLHGSLDTLFDAQGSLPRLPQTMVVVARVMSESDVLAPHHVGALRAVDELWVPTSFHKRVFERHGIAPERVVVVPEAVDVDFFAPHHRRARARALTATAHHNPHPVAQALEEARVMDFAEFVGRVDATPPHDNAARPFLFGSVFKWEGRKGWDVLLLAFWRAFGVCEGARALSHPRPWLVLRTYKPSWERGPSHIPTFISHFFRYVRSSLSASDQRCAGPDHVVWVASELSAEELRDLYWASDSFVLPTRGEGWGLPVAEAMAAALPVLVTNFSGPTEFATTHNAFLLRYSRAGSAVVPDALHLAELMQEVVGDADNARRVGARARESMGRFSAEAAVEKMTQRLLALARSRQMERARHTEL